MAKLELTKYEIEFLEQELTKKGIRFKRVHNVNPFVLRDLCEGILDEEKGPGFTFDDHGNMIRYKGSPDYNGARHDTAIDLYYGPFYDLKKKLKKKWKKKTKKNK